MSTICRLELLKGDLIANHNPCQGVVMGRWWSYQRQYWKNSDWITDRESDGREGILPVRQKEECLGILTSLL